MTAMKSDPGLYDYNPYIDRPKIEWPNGAKVALWVAPNIEFYELALLQGEVFPSVPPH